MSDTLHTQRILLVITTLTFGGAETQVVHLAREFKQRGWTVAIACLLTASAWVEQLENEGIAVHSLEMRRGLPDLRAIFRLRSLIKAFRPDIVHSHMVHANLLARFTRLFCGMPVLVSTAHNLRETSQKGGPTWHKELMYRLTDFLADRTTIICRAAFERYVKVGAVRANKFEVVPNGINMEQFSNSTESRLAARTTLGLSDSTFVWLTVGRLVEQKDYSTLLQAVHLLPDSDFRLLIAGGGSLLNALKKECSDLGLSKKVQFLGTSENMRPLYAASDAFVMSSVFEGLSAALLEASAMGLPAVVTDVGGNTEIVTHGATGYVVPASNPTRLCEAMKRLMLADATTRQTLGAAAKQHCLDTYRFEIVVDHWLDLYSRCLSRRPVQRRSVNKTEVVDKLPPVNKMDSVPKR